MKRTLSLLLVLFCLVMANAQNKFTEFSNQEPSFAKMQQANAGSETTFRYQELNRQHQLHLVKKVKKNDIPGDKAQVILEARNLWGTPLAGYQMLMDETAQSYNDVFYVNEYNNSYCVYIGEYHSLFSYTIPENVKTPSDAIVSDGYESILIPAGTYDYLIGLAEPADKCLYYAWGDYATGNDFVFQGGYAYHFKLEMIGYNDVTILEVDKDAAAEKVVLPANSPDLTDKEIISVIIANNGKSVISGFTISYQINNETPVTEIYNGSIATGEQATYTFATKADFSVAGTYKVKASVELDGDLNPLNNSIEGECRHFAIQYTPYFYDFSSEELFYQDWTIIDNNNDETTWTYYGWLAGADGTMGAAACPGYWQGNDDYLISSPIYLEAGKNNVSFYTKVVNNTRPESLNVLVGKSMVPGEFDTVGEMVFNNTFWRQWAYTFEVDESGIYYVAFQGVSPNGMNIHFDDVLVDAGEYQGSPLLVMQRVLAPYPNCDFSQETPIGARLINYGTAPASSIEMSYTIDGIGETITENFDHVLEIDESYDYYFEQTADLSNLGAYVITVEAESGASEVSATVSTMHYNPLEVPFESHFQNNTHIDGYWTSLTEGAWEYDSWAGKWGTDLSGIDNGFMLRCLTINNSFRIRIAYMGGGLWSDPASMYIACGKPGTDIGTWEKIYEASDITDERDLEFMVNLDDPGEYSFVIVNDTPGARLGLFYFYISEVFDYDIRITGADYPLAPYTPVKQIPFEGEYTVYTENRGLKTSTGIGASVVLDGTTLGTSEQKIDLGPEGNGVLTVSGAISQAKVGDKLNINLNIAQTEEEQHASDNDWALPTVHATESVLAMENITEFVNGIGEYGGIYFGHVYNILTPDVLTSMSFGLALNEYYEYETIGAAVYKMKADGLTIDYELFSTSFERGAGGALIDVPLEEPILLTPGKYFFEARQLEKSYNIGLAYEENSQMVAYMNVDGTLVANPGGVLCVRGNFVTGATALVKDAKAVGFVKPKHQQSAFSSQEIISANIKNAGSEEITGMEVVCDVNGIKHSTRINIRPYETKEVAFTVDMATPGDYTVTITTALEGDENDSNNAITCILTSLPVADPYFLDFELCHDFDTDHEFNPLWWTVDRKDHEVVNAWWQYDYPYKEQPVGFMAFNRAATTPIMPDDAIPGFFPYSGVRFGAAFGLAYGTEGDGDTWLVSPKLALGKESVLELYVKSYLKEYYNEEERYNLLISTTTDDFDSFVVLGGERLAPFDEWTKVIVDLNEYNNSEVYIAIQYVSESVKGVVMMVDDIHIKTNLTAIDQLAGNDITARYSNAGQVIEIKSGNLIKKVEVHSITGQVVYQSSHLNIYNHRIDMADRPAGVYLVSIHTQTGIKTIKLLKA